jgi:hypothetical protein
MIHGPDPKSTRNEMVSFYEMGTEAQKPQAKKQLKQHFNWKTG